MHLIKYDQTQCMQLLEGLRPKINLVKVGLCTLPILFHLNLLDLRWVVNRRLSPNFCFRLVSWWLPNILLTLIMKAKPIAFSPATALATSSASRFSWRSLEIHILHQSIHPPIQVISFSTLSFNWLSWNVNSSERFLEKIFLFAFTSFKASAIYLIAKSRSQSRDHIVAY